MPTPGKYIVIEGHDGTGKSTQVSLVMERLAKMGVDSIEIHEPAKDPKDGPEDILIADAIRTILKDGTLERDAMTNLLLFSAARHEIWHKKARPALAAGKWVVASRNYYSTLAYQGYGEGLSIEHIEAITLAATDELYLKPDIAMILSLDNDTRKERIAKRGATAKPDTFESRGNDFQTRIQNGYLEIASTHSLPVIDASQSIEGVSHDVWSLIRQDESAD